MIAIRRLNSRFVSMKRRLGLLATLALGIEMVLSAQGGFTPSPPPPPPDMINRDAAPPAPRTMPVGTASLLGVVTAGDNGRPLKNVRVSLIGTVTAPGNTAAAPFRAGGAANVVPISRSAVTDALGQFSFLRLPGGDFNLSATRGQYLTTSYGQKKPGRPGTRILLTDGQQMRVTLQMMGGGVTPGVVNGDDGEPM